MAQIGQEDALRITNTITRCFNRVHFLSTYDDGSTSANYDGDLGNEAGLANDQASFTETQVPGVWMGLVNAETKPGPLSPRAGHTDLHNTDLMTFLWPTMTERDAQSLTEALKKLNSALERHDRGQEEHRAAMEQYTSQ